MNDTAFPSDSFDEDSMLTMRPGSGPSLGRIDQYELVRKLGGGGFGVVYLARDTNGGVEVAIKTLHPLLKHSPEEMEALRAKFALVSRLAHPNVATALVLHPVRDVSIPDETARRELKLSPGDSVMVMRYAPGVTLSKWRRQFPDGVVPPELALEIGRQIASALDYAHSEKIVHRDVKPSNVMVETLAAEPPQAVDHGHGGALPPGAPKIRVRILDFGLAAEIRSSMSRISTEQGDTSGTRPYMAPEQWLGRKQDGRTDQYALACVLYELLSGTPPFSGVFETGDPMIMMAAVKGESPEEIDDLPPAANAALLRALAKAPKDRFPTCGAFMAALSSGTEGRDGSTSRPPDGRAVGASLPETAGGASPPVKPQRESGISGRALPPGAPRRSEEAARSASAPYQATAAVEDEAALLLRKAAMQDALAEIPDADRADKEFGPIADEAIHAFAAAEDALKFGRPVVAATCLDRADAALARLSEARQVREETRKRNLREEEERRRRVAEEEDKRRRRAEEEASRRHRLQQEMLSHSTPPSNAWMFGRRQERNESPMPSSSSPDERSAFRRRFWLGVFSVLATILICLFFGQIDSRTEEGASSSRSHAALTPSSGERKVVTVDGVELALRWCPPGTFLMGSPSSEEGRYDGETQHRVTLTKGFWMGETEVTQGLWTKVMGDNPSDFKSGGDHPVENVSWNDCQEFLSKINAQAPVAGFEWRLPTEAQWEYACRAGTTGPYAGTGWLDDMGWYDENSGNATHRVGTKKANAWGFFDMHGNVWEWCADGYGSYPSEAVTDPTGAFSGSDRVSRGGSWIYFARGCRSASRYIFDPGYRSIFLGFRVALVPVQ